jgi:hypothetical protein
MHPPIRYDRHVGKTLRAFAEKHATQIDEVEGRDRWEPYHIYLRQGWHVGDDVTHSYSADTTADLMAHFRSAPPAPCDCRDCIK